MIQLDSNPLARICVAQDAPELREYAAKELQTYLCRITGERIPVERVATAPKCGEIWLVESADGFLRTDYDRIRVFTADGILFLQGENAISVLYAVYDFLQAFCGVRFFAPGDAFEHVPARASVTLDSAKLPYENGSAFEIRDFVNRTNSHDVFSFAVKNRINTILAHLSHLVFFSKFNGTAWPLRSDIGGLRL